MLVSIHMPKTGGTSFGEILKASFDKILWISGRQGILDFLQMAPEERCAYPAAAGHMPFGLGDYVSVACQYVVFLREPVDHTISAYYYVLNTPSNPQHARASNMTLREYVESDIWWINDNQQTRRLASYDWTEAINNPPKNWNRASPCDAELLRQSKANLDCCYFVGLYERYEESVRACCERFGLKCPEIPYLNSTPGRPAVRDIEPEVLEVIRERRHFDIELYEHALRRFESLTASRDKPRPLRLSGTAIPRGLRVSSRNPLPRSSSETA